MSYNDFPSKGREKRQERRNKAKRYKARDRNHGKPRERDDDNHSAHMRLALRGAYSSRIVHNEHGEV